ncbi:hypothetical protein Bbelb_074840 [Branchiostoma belcheri]|nr:hypothetical protein Bbelb_074840 [Branchiostoma belcheri]
MARHIRWWEGSISRDAQTLSTRGGEISRPRRPIRRHSDLSAARADISAVGWRYQVSPSCFQRSLKHPQQEMPRRLRLTLYPRKRCRRKSTLKADKESDIGDGWETEEEDVSKVPFPQTVRDHVFPHGRLHAGKDNEGPSTHLALCRLTYISGPNEPSRGARGVRQHHRVDESKMLPSGIGL